VNISGKSTPISWRFTDRAEKPSICQPSLPEKKVTGVVTFVSTDVKSKRATLDIVECAGKRVATSSAAVRKREL